MKNDDQTITDSSQTDIESEVQDLKRKIELLELNSESEKIKVFGKVSIISVLISVILFLGYSKWQDFQKEIENKIKNEVTESIRKTVPRESVRTVSSIKLNQAINDYIKYSLENPISHENKTNNRLLLMIDINGYIDFNKYGGMEIRQTILDNQLALVEFIPFLIDDIINLKSFKRDSNVAFWILHKQISYSYEPIRKKTIDLLCNKDVPKNLKCSDKKLIDCLYEICNPLIKSNKKDELREIYENITLLMGRK